MTRGFDPAVAVSASISSDGALIVVCIESSSPAVHLI